MKLHFGQTNRLGTPGSTLRSDRFVGLAQPQSAVTVGHKTSRKGRAVDAEMLKHFECENEISFLGRRVPRAAAGDRGRGPSFLLASCL